MPHEVITLQLGSFANFVGAHYWNFQVRHRDNDAACAATYRHARELRRLLPPLAAAMECTCGQLILLPRAGPALNSFAPPILASRLSKDELLGLQEQAGGLGPAAAIDCDALFRAGEAPGGQPTYTPRLVLCDLSGALGGASAGGALYRDLHQPGSAVAAGVSTWAGGREVHRAAPVPRSRFSQELENEAEEPAEEGTEGGDTLSDGSSLATAAAQLDGSGGGGGVRYWTDYLKAHVHPRSVHQLAGAWHGLTPFSGWGDSSEHWRSEEQREEMLERIRCWGATSAVLLAGGRGQDAAMVSTA